jgi:tetratricopeptide (TPR) repeat protein
VGRGECREAVRHCEAALALIPEGLAQERFGQATIQGSQVRTVLAIALGALGRFAEAFGRLREAMHIAEEAGHVYTLVFPLFSLGTLKLDQGDFAGAVAPLERGLDLCRTRLVPLLLHDFAWALGAAYHGTGRRAEAVVLMEDAARGFAERTVRMAAGWAGHVGALGGAYLLDGRLTDATLIAQEGLAAARQRGERGVEGQLMRLLGDIAAHHDAVEAETADAHYRQALGIAGELGMRPLIAHCHLGLGKLYRRMGKRELAREHLTAATTMYREMDMRFGLEQAEGEIGA